MSGGTLAYAIATAYDADNEITSTSDPDSASAMTYDNLGDALTVDNAGTPNVPHVVLTAGHDVGSNRTSLAASINGTADFLNTYAFDADQRLTSEVQQQQAGGNGVAPKELDFGYNALGQFTSAARYDFIGVGPRTDIATGAYSYDGANRLTGLNYTYAGGGFSIDGYTLGYDNADRLTISASTADGTASYGYDSTNQLVSANYTGTNAPPNAAYSFDKNGNRTMTGYQTGTDNQLGSDGTFNYQYDANGNRTVRTRISNDPANDYQVKYTYDYRNRETDEEDFNNSGVLTKHVHLVYDTLDNEIGKQVDDTGGGSYDRTERYVLDGTQPVAQFDGNGNLTERNLNGPSAAGDDTVLAQEGIATQGQAGTTNWDLTDNLGTTRYVINNSSAVVDHVVDNAFGQTTTETNAAIAHWNGFAGGHTDRDTSDVLNGERRYDASTGGWTTQDPLGFAGGDANPGRYSGNSPTNLIDHTGMAPQEPWNGGDYNLDPALKSEYAAWMMTGFDPSTPPPTAAQNLQYWFESQMATNYLMMKHPVATFQGAANGLMDGGAMVVNAATMGNISSLNDYVNMTVAQNGGAYAFANWSANMGVQAGYSAIMIGAPCSYAATGINMMNGANGAGNMYNGYQSGNYLQMMQGTMQLGGAMANAANGMCFVAGTQVVMASADSPQLAGIEGAAPTRGGTALAPCLIVAIGITGLAPSRRSRRDEEAEEEAAQRAATDALFGTNSDDDEDAFLPRSHGSCDAAFLLDLWAGRGAASATLVAPGQTAVYGPTGMPVNSASLDERAAHGAAPPMRPSSSRGLTASRRPAALGSVVPPPAPPKARRSPRRTGVIWLAACLLLAGWVGRRDPAPSVSERAMAARGTTDVSAFARPTKPIEQIRVGERVVANNPDMPDAGSPGETAVDPETWRSLRLHAEYRWEDGTLDTVEVETIQSLEWIKQCSARPGALVPLPLDLLEMGMPEDLRATVVSIEPCPLIADGPGHVVLTTVSHLNAFICELSVEDASGRRETFKPTGFHKFYSETRHEWVSASGLRRGERLRGRGGMLTLVSSRRVPGTQRVYNMTVEGQHVYHVSALGVLVHNQDCTSLWKAPQPGNPDPAGEMINGYDPANYPGNGPYFGTTQSVAEQYQYNYQNGMQQVNLPTETYNDLINNGIIVPDPGMPPGAAVNVPAAGLPQFNAAIQQGPPNVFFPQMGF